MSSYLLPIHLSGSVSLNPSFTEGSVTCILPSQSEAVYFYRFHIISLCLLCFHSKYNLSWLLAWPILYLSQLQLLSFSYSLILKLSRDQKTLQPLLYELGHFKKRQILSSHQKTGNVVQMVKDRHSSLHKILLSLLSSISWNSCIQFKLLKCVCNFVQL